MLGVIFSFSGCKKVKDWYLYITELQINFPTYEQESGLACYNYCTHIDKSYNGWPEPYNGTYLDNGEYKPISSNYVRDPKPYSTIEEANKAGQYYAKYGPPSNAVSQGDSGNNGNNNGNNSTSITIGGVTWATCNVNVAGGGFVSKPEEYGGYFAYLNLFKFGQLSQVIPSGWRLPTEQDIKKLYDAPYKWTTKNGVAGMEFGTAPNTVFFPAAGFKWTTMDGIQLQNAGSNGYYMSSTTDNPDERHVGLAFSQSGLRDWYYRYNFNVFDFFSIRCVK